MGLQNGGVEGVFSRNETLEAGSGAYDVDLSRVAMLSSPNVFHRKNKI